jgi:hypothetical protein
MPDRRNRQDPFFGGGLSLDRRVRGSERRQQRGLPRIFYIGIRHLWNRILAKTSRSASKIVLVEIGSFGAIIVISWANESGLETFFFGETYTRNWKDPIMQTAITIMVAIPTIVLSWRLSKRLHYLEGFLRVCPWCRKVGQGDEWVSIEDYVGKTLNTQTTHGICPSCLIKIKEEENQ